MAGLLCIAKTDEIALVAATAKTVLQIEAPANQRLKIKSWGIFFDGISGVEPAVEVVLMRQTVGSSEWTGTVACKIQSPAGVSETVQTVGDYNATAEPTTGDIVDMIESHPQSGYEKLIPFDMPIDVPGAGLLGIVCTAPAVVNVRAKIIFEE